MTKIHYKSDFDFTLRLVGDAVGGFPEFDWRLIIATPNSPKPYFASCIGGVCVNCMNADGKIRVVMKDHGLAPGELQLRFVAYLNNSLYPDGIQMVAIPANGGITLTRLATELPSQIEADVAVPYAVVTAYDMACKAGYTGTPEEYVKALALVPKILEEGGTGGSDAEGMTADEGRELAEQVFGEAELPEAEGMSADEGRELAEMIFS